MLGRSLWSHKKWMMVAPHAAAAAATILNYNKSPSFRYESILFAPNSETLSPQFKHNHVEKTSIVFW